MSVRIVLHFEDDDSVLKVSTSFVRKYLTSIDGDAYLDYHDGEEPVKIKGFYDDVFRALLKAEKMESEE